MTIYRADKSYDIPNLDLLTFLFDYGDVLDNTPIHCEAENPSVIYTKGEGRQHTKNLAHGLRSKFDIGASGPGKDVVVVISSGQAYLPIAFYAVIAAGGLYSAASSSFTVSELVRQIRDGAANLIICSKDVVHVATAAAKECGVPLSRVLVLESNPVYRLYDVEREENCISRGELDWERITNPEVLESRPVTLLYSSGTTGVPKGVPLSHMNIVSESYIPGRLHEEYQAKREAAGKPPFEYRTLAHLPAAHIAGCQGYFVNPLHGGGLTFWMSKFDFPKFLEYNRKFQITFFFTVPPIYLLISKSPLVTDHFKTLEFAISGAAPMGKELQHAASTKMGDSTAFVSQTWGLSETTGSVTFMPWGESDDTGSVSLLMPNVSMRIVDDDGKDVAEGEPGEILAKGPMVFKGYHNNPKATAESFKDGWFLTGDIGHIRNGMVYIVDRKKELIKYKGNQVAPAELEALLISHPLIADAAVIGVEGVGNDEATEVPRAYVVADQSKISEGAIKDFVKEKAARHKQLRGGVVFMDIIPKSPSGKILRKELREAARKELRAKL